MDNSDDEDEVVAIAAPFAEAIEHEDELVKYLALPLERADCDLQEWWKTHKFRFPSLAKMAREFLAVPASTAGVERIFSAAGQMHSDLRKSTKEETLQHSLMAALNTV
ncbi:hypothetical protein CYMTET_34858 [Cymbomonas tetramitiformis]|uniref:HAT C-terminal dimerisation domain-containing protein n=1 Tax=Cymbomonas tetramitiformis TaxID=36881 RepID=A0AAE0FA70_9CHLO|nr:hypothetical protein CYMTET_34858 [Cymbomonas tetramitiformis]